MTTPTTQFYNNPNKGDILSNPSQQLNTNNKPQVSNNTLDNGQRASFQSNQNQSQPQFQPQAQQLQQQQHSSKQSVQLQQAPQQLQQQLPKQNQPQPNNNFDQSRDSKTRSQSPEKSFVSSSLDRPLFNPQADLQSGKSEE